MQIHIIGDSQVNLFRDNPRDRIVVCELGEKAAISGTDIATHQKLTSYLRHNIKRNDKIVFALGEVDCQINIYKTHVETGTPISDLIDKTIRGYCDWIESNAKAFKRGHIDIAVLNVIPPEVRADDIASNIHREFHDKLSTIFSARGCKVIDVWDKIEEDSGRAIVEYLIEGIDRAFSGTYSNASRMHEMSSRVISYGGQVRIMDLDPEEQILGYFAAVGGDFEYLHLPVDFDLNKNPEIIECAGRVHYVICSNILEHITDLPRLFKSIWTMADNIILSYNIIRTQNSDEISKRRSLGWINDLTLDDIQLLVRWAGFQIEYTGFPISDHPDEVIIQASRPGVWFTTGNSGCKLKAPITGWAYQIPDGDEK